MADATGKADISGSVQPVSVREQLGPQYQGDDPFAARMRAHQSWWRAARLRAPFGTGPALTSTSRYGSYLTAEDAEQGLNFLDSRIFDVVRDRMAAGPGVERFRCLRNLLSSQPLCFNLFGLLVDDPETATRFLTALFPDEIAQVRSVWIEYSPSPKVEYLGDNTAFDAFVIYDRVDGMPAFLGIETKLSEPFSSRVYDTARYREVARASRVFRDAEDPKLADIHWNQLWRDHLLAEALIQHPSAPEALSGRLVVVHHPADKRCVAALSGYADLLEPGAAINSWPLDWLVERWIDAARDDHETKWVEALRDRYVDLSLSDDAWLALRATPSPSNPNASVPS